MQKPGGVVPFLSAPLLPLARRPGAFPPPHLPSLLTLALADALLQQFGLITWQRAIHFVRLVLCCVSK